MGIHGWACVNEEPDSSRRARVRVRVRIRIRVRVRSRATFKGGGDIFLRVHFL